MGSDMQTEPWMERITLLSTDELRGLKISVDDEIRKRKEAETPYPPADEQSLDDGTQRFLRRMHDHVIERENEEAERKVGR